MHCNVSEDKGKYPEGQKQLLLTTRELRYLFSRLMLGVELPT